MSNTIAKEYYQSILDKIAANNQKIEKIKMSKNIIAFNNAESFLKFLDQEKERYGTNDPAIVKSEAETKSIHEKLKNCKELQELNELQDENKLLRMQRARLFRNIKISDYGECKHYLITTEVYNDFIEGRGYRRFGCIKCGLDESNIGCQYEQTEEEKVMKEYLHNTSAIPYENKRFDLVCYLPVARAIYNRILEKNPGIDEQTAIKYFERALAYIRKEKVSDAREESRMKRLNLRYQDAKWYEAEVGGSC